MLMMADFFAYLTKINKVRIKTFHSKIIVPQEPATVQSLRLCVQWGRRD
jgi:hypothetical protein